MCRCGLPATANGRECPACFRARIASVCVGYAPSRSLGAGRLDTAASRKMMRRLEAYRQARAEGIQPRTTRRFDIDMARRLSDLAGRAFRADRGNER